MPTFPEWWEWELLFSPHAERRMVKRRVTEMEVRAMLERASGYEPDVLEGRFMIHLRHARQPWIAIVEPNIDDRILVVVTIYEVS